MSDLNNNYFFSPATDVWLMKEDQELTVYLQLQVWMIEPSQFQNCPAGNLPFHVEKITSQMYMRRFMTKSGWCKIASISNPHVYLLSQTTHVHVLHIFSTYCHISSYCHIPHIYYYYYRFAPFYILEEVSSIEI